MRSEDGKYDHEQRTGKMVKASEACFKAYEIHKSVQQSHLPAGIQTGVLAVRQAAVHDTPIKRVT
jgi:hypothetical protein